MAPRDHRIHLGRMDSLKTLPQNHSSTKQLFSGPFSGAKKVPGPKCRPGDPKSDPGLQNPPPGMKKQKMRAEKPCRTPPSKNQTEPYSASYGQKPFWGVPLMSGIWELAGALGSQGWPSDDLRGKCRFSVEKIENEKSDHFVYILKG